uniref:glycoside hydrolase family 2 TIM barrel-domain containing protein n=1 Tax=Listeria monocytogenes TaxID=1639 RepID=UPI00240FD668
NLNLMRIWGGALVERPEFYQACDKYGLLVMPDFWMSGDCNGRWLDPLKLEDQWPRRQYPSDHRLFIKSVADQIKLVRNHASLAMWCGGNEITPPKDILTAMQDTLLPQLDGTRWFIPY